MREGLSFLILKKGGFVIGIPTTCVERVEKGGRGEVLILKGKAGGFEVEEISGFSAKKREEILPIPSLLLPFLEGSAVLGFAPEDEGLLILLSSSVEGISSFLEEIENTGGEAL